MRSIEERLRSLEKSACCKKDSGLIPEGEYRMARFPNGTAPVTFSDDLVIGELFDESLPLSFLGFYFKLSNNNIAVVDYCISVLKNGIFIYEAFDLQSEEANNGYWVTFKVDPANPNRLIKLAELKMTTQFWDYWYDYTVKDGINNQVKFVTKPEYSDYNSFLQNSVVTLTCTDDEISVVEVLNTFENHSFLSLYNFFTGAEVEKPEFQIKYPEYILDDDYYGMGIGEDYGWCYYRDVSNTDIINYWKIIGINLLTGETRFLDTNAVLSNVTNMDFSAYLTGPCEALSDFTWYSHPSGLLFCLSDNQLSNLGTSLANTTAIWSPYWENITEVIYLIGRDLEGNKIAVGKDFILDWNKSYWYWDSSNLYMWSWQIGSLSSMILYSFNFKTKERKDWILPLFSSFIEPSNIYMNISFPNNNSLVIITEGLIGLSPWGQKTYTVLTGDKYPLRLHTNHNYPTNLIKDKAYSHRSSLQYQQLGLGIGIDQWDNINF